MTYRVTILSPVHEELADAATWYESQRGGLGVDLVEAFDALLDRVQRSPMQFPRLDEQSLQRAVLERFPYVLVFEVRDHAIRVLAFAHTSRRPGYWRDR